jgi:hypothetical protein
MIKKKKFEKVTFNYSEAENKSEILEVDEKYHKYIKRMMDNTENNEESSKNIKGLLNEYALIYHSAMNFLVPLMDEIDEKLLSLKEKRIKGQSMEEFSMELIMLDKELESHYSMMEPLHDLYKLIKQKDTQVFKKGYEECKERTENIIAQLADLYEK